MYIYIYTYLFLCTYMLTCIYARSCHGFPSHVYAYAYICMCTYIQIYRYMLHLIFHTHTYIEPSGRSQVHRRSMFAQQTRNPSILQTSLPCTEHDFVRGQQLPGFLNRGKVSLWRDWTLSRPQLDTSLEVFLVICLFSINHPRSCMHCISSSQPFSVLS